MTWLKKILGIAQLEEQLKTKDQQLHRLAQGHIHVIDVALDQPGIAADTRQRLEYARDDAVAITMSGARLVM